jgi:CBS domain-containing protein
MRITTLFPAVVGLELESEEEAKMTFVRDLLQGKPAEVWGIGPRDSVYKALELMAEKNIGALPVVEEGNLVGMFSERDYARKVILVGKSSRAIAVEEIMSHPVFCVEPDDTLETCIELMTAKHIRHLPVCGGDPLLGMVSIGDVLKSVIAKQQVLIKDLENYIVGARS